MFRMVIGLVCAACSGEAFNETSMVETENVRPDAGSVSDTGKDSEEYWDSSPGDSTPSSDSARLDSGGSTDGSMAIVCNGRVCPICGGSDTCCTLANECGCGYLSVHKCYPLPESNP